MNRASIEIPISSAGDIRQAIQSRLKSSGSKTTRISQRTTVNGNAEITVRSRSISHAELVSMLYTAAGYGNKGDGHV